MLQDYCESKKDIPSRELEDREGICCMLWRDLGLYLSGPQYCHTQILLRVSHFKGQDMWRVYSLRPGAPGIAWYNALSAILFRDQGLPS